MQIFLTTNNPGSYFVADLGEVTFTHPLTNLALVEPTGEFTLKDVQNSGGLLSFVSSGDITLTNSVGQTLTTLGDLEQTEVNDLTSSVIWTNVPDANITQSSVIQHQTSIDHDVLTNYVADEHATPKQSIEIDAGQLHLVNDLNSPSNNSYYGTNNSGLKGWYSTPVIINSTIKVISTAADQLDNYNIAGSEVALVLSGAVTTAGTGNTDFTNVNGVITCNFNGTILMIGNVPHISSATRVSLKSIFQVNTGSGFNNYGSPCYAYIRSNNGITRGKNTLIEFISVSSGDQIRIGMRRGEDATNNTAINLLNETNIILRRWS